jgi:hypothetical protein
VRDSIRSADQWGARGADAWLNHFGIAPDQTVEALAPPRERTPMMKLLIAGLALIALGLALVVFTDLNPALLFIAGVICAFVAVIRDAQGPDCGSAVPADSLVDSETL